MKLPLRNSLPTIHWRIPDEKVYLTFDDGPDPQVTPRLLRLLDQFHIQATFFLLGEKVERHPEIVRQMKERGHGIGNHSFYHPRMLGLPKERIMEEVTRTDEAIQKITGKQPRLFRPPYGWFGKELLRVLKTTAHQMLLWSASGKDYKTGATAEIIQNTLQKIARPGRIILLHDGHPNSPNTLIALANSLGELKRRGLRFSAVPPSVIHKESF